MISKKMYDAINDQVKHELESAYIYLSMVGYFHSQNLDGMAHWMRVQVHEETIHAMKFFDHLTNRGVLWSCRTSAAQDGLEEPAGALEGRLCPRTVHHGEDP
jgi:ferritin